jgi:hypothetical protein
MLATVLRHSFATARGKHPAIFPTSITGQSQAIAFVRLKGDGEVDGKK